MFRLFSIFFAFDKMAVFEDFSRFVIYNCIGPAGGDVVDVGVFKEVCVFVDCGDMVC